METIDLSQFTLIAPSPKLSLLAININASGNVNLSGKLKHKISSPTVGLHVFNDGTKILLDPKERESFNILKSGSIRAEEFTRELVSRGIILPARYTTEWNEEVQMWLGTLVKSIKPQKVAPIIKSNLKKPRTTGLKDMLP